MAGLGMDSDQLHRAGRPRLPAEQKKTRLSLTLSKKALALVDHNRGTLPRSTFIESLLRDPTDARSEIRRNGAVYTPRNLADFVAAKAAEHLLHTMGANRVQLQKLRVLDPASGNGELLESMWVQLDRHFQGKADPRDVLCAVDIDPLAASETAARLRHLASKQGVAGQRGTNVLTDNALFPFNSSTSAAGWERVKDKFDAPDGFDLIIANPPWGADISGYRDKLSSDEFVLFHGQSDTSDLFLELSLKLTKPNGIIAFIVPDSLFSFERKLLRQLLLQRTRILLLARLGERLFDSINRACAVVVCQNRPAPAGWQVPCLRLTPKARSLILAGRSTFAEQEVSLTRHIPQDRFLNNHDYALDIDLDVQEEPVVGVFRTARGCLGDVLRSTRGVELSKSGLVCRCLSCRHWLPLPGSSTATCRHCGGTVAGARVHPVSIVHKSAGPNRVPFIVGESICRYQLRQSLWIEQGMEGINYKEDEAYLPPKLLVRKTGVGLSAAIDYSRSYTNQVVYIFRHHGDQGDSGVPLEALLGILCSRAMYYYLTKKHGETEWRSHPYVTQAQLLALPLPGPDVLRRHQTALKRMAGVLSPYLRSGKEPPIDVDASVERDVAGLYGLKASHYRQIYATLDSVQELLPVRKLKRVGMSDIF